MSELEKLDHGDDIAVIGMAGRFPGARSVDELWDNLCAGIESVSFFSVDELVQSGIQRDLVSRSDYVRAKGVCDDIDLFDSSFFEINSREADFMDPQHRVLLECAWEALEDAGYDPARFTGRVGVFAGQGQNYYLATNLLSNKTLVESVGPHLALLGNGSDYLTTRISYKLGLKGPSVNVQTACSTSLVAIHIACQSLLNGECEMALAGGVSITLPAKSGYIYQQSGILSPDGHCRAFDANAQGCVEGNGAGIVVLKLLDKALADGDRLLAVVKGSAINNDGGLKVGYTAPSVEGQANVIKEALDIACVDAETITYVETHGTGTNLGDPIEISALNDAFRDVTGKQHCAIASLKTNIGHLDVAAGIAGFIKATFAVRHGVIPPSLNFERPNPEIDFDNSPFYVNTALTEWKPKSIPRRAGVSSFGIGGTNAHIVLEEPPAGQVTSAPAEVRRDWKLLLLSARTASALERAAENLAQHLRGNPELDLDDICYTLQAGRHQFECRQIAVIRDMDGAIAALSGADPKSVSSSSFKPKNGPLVFMFPGQGSQFADMCRGLYEQERTFREQVDLCSRLFENHLGFDLRNRIFTADPSSKSEVDQALGQTHVTQPSLFVVEYALAKLWISLGVKPEVMIGHSIGEYVAACLAGVFSLEDAIKVVAARGKLMQSLPEGAMLAVGLGEEEIRSILVPDLSIAAVNGPSSCVVSGTPDSVTQFENRLADRRVMTKRLRTSHAFHSSMMDPIIDRFGEVVDSIKLSTPRISFISNLTGSTITHNQATDARYWTRQLRETVRFDDGLRELLKNPDCRLLEVGPGRSLTNLARRHPDRAETQIAVSSVGSHDSDQASLLNAMGQLWLAGADINWSYLYNGETRRRVRLPTYPFERRRHWVEPSTASGEHAATRPSPGGKKADVGDWFYLPLWTQTPPPTRVDVRDLTESACWWLFLDKRGIGDALADFLRAAKQAVVTVKPGSAFHREGDGEFIIAPANHADYAQLVTTLESEGHSPSHIVHLWLVDDETPDKQVETGFESLIRLAQALGAKSDSRRIEISVISSGMQKVAAESLLYPEKATVLGACKVIPQEYPNVTCRSVDVIADGPGATPAGKLVEWLRSELCGKSTEPVIAYRGDGRWVQVIEPARLEETRSFPSLLRERGVYLITGGMGGIGLEIARYLAETAKARLVLTGRSRLPDRSDWERWVLSHAPFDETSRRLSKLLAIEELGSDVLICSADVTDGEQMKEVVRLARKQFGELNGVIHAAGVPGGGAIQLMSRETMEGVLAPKLRGARVLDELVDGNEMDFSILFSSMTSVTGGFGQSAYCAANAFLDAFAAAKNGGTNGVTLSIAWDSWREVGMAARLADSELKLGDLVASGKTDHPLLDHYAVEVSERETYVTEFSPDRHWILDDHRIVGNPVIPGSAYLEMARAAYERSRGNGDPIELRDVFFVTPLRVPDGDKATVYTVLEKQGDGFRFEMKSRNGAPRWQQHAMGRINRFSPGDPRQLPIQEIIGRCSLREVSPAGNKLDEDDGPRWQSIKQVFVGESEVVVAIELKEAFESDLDMLKLHPSLLDIATGAPKYFVAQGSAYLPLSYRQLIMRGPLRSRMYSYASLKPTSDNETLTFDIVITDEDGVELVEVRDFVTKRVNDAAIKMKAWEDEDPRTAGDKTHDLLRDGMLTSEAVDAFARILDQPIASRIIISTRPVGDVIDEINSFSASGVLKERSSAAGFHPRPELETAYVAPRTDLEKRIAEVWQELFGIDRIGVNDNFFELGGDSVLAIQIIGRCNQLGIQIPPQELFQHPTVAELVLVAQPSADAGSDAAPAAFPLIPAQVALLDEQATFAGAARVVLIRLAKELDVGMLEQAIQRMASLHQVFRLQFQRTEAGWRQQTEQFSENIAVEIIPAESGEMRESAIKRVAHEMSRDINPVRAPLARAAILQFAHESQPGLLLAGHSLIMDETSLAIVLDDLATAYQQIKDGLASQVSREAVPFTRWVESVRDRMERGFSDHQVGYWLSEAWEPAAAPFAAPATNSNAQFAISSFAVRFTAEETQLLSEQVSNAYRARIEEVLLTALVHALSLMCARRKIAVEIDYDCRQNEEDLNLSRTVGPIYISYPVLFDVSGSADPGSALKSVKEQLRAVQPNGWDYALASSFGDESETARRLRELPRPLAGFSFTNWSGAARLNHSLGVIGIESIGPAVSRRSLDVRTRIIDERLELEISFDESKYELSSIRELAGHFETELRRLMEYSSSAGVSGYSPSDFPLAKLDERNLNKLAFLIDQSDS